jgi:hypothetical protein
MQGIQGGEESRYRYSGPGVGGDAGALEGDSWGRRDWRDARTGFFLVRKRKVEAGVWSWFCHQ